MRAKPNRTVFLVLASLVFGGTTALSTLAGFLIAGGAIGILQNIGHEPLPPPRVTATLLHPVALRQEAVPSPLLTPADRRRIEETVRAQIRAYAGRDAEQAFAALSPSTQQIFGKPERFLRSVAQDMPTILDTRRFAFLGLGQQRDLAVQQVLIMDGMGQEWLAEFQLEEQAPGDWRIKGCTVQATPGQQA